VYARKYFDREALVFFNTSKESKKISVTLPEYFDKQQFSATFGTEFKLNGRELTIELPALSVEILL
jgi:hypothetical protein